MKRYSQHEDFAGTMLEAPDGEWISAEDHDREVKLWQDAIASVSRDYYAEKDRREKLEAENERLKEQEDAYRRLVSALGELVVENRAGDGMYGSDPTELVADLANHIESLKWPNEYHETCYELDIAEDRADRLAVVADALAAETEQHTLKAESALTECHRQYNELYESTRLDRIAFKKELTESRQREARLREALKKVSKRHKFNSAFHKGAYDMQQIAEQALRGNKEAS